MCIILDFERALLYNNTVTSRLGGTVRFFMLNNGLFRELIAPAMAGNESAATFIYFALVFAVLLGSYLLGSINTAILVSKLLYRTDIRTLGSGNAGLTNMHRNFGAKAALFTLLGDMLKTAVAIFICGLLFGFSYYNGISLEFMPYFAGLFTVIGHIFPMYYRFKGGKGVLSTATMILILAPLCFLILFAVFVAIVAISKYVSLGSCCVVFLLPIVIYGQQSLMLGGYTNPGTLLATMILAVLIIYCHRGNLKRVFDGTERRFSFKKKAQLDTSAEAHAEDDADN